MSAGNPTRLATKWSSPLTQNPQKPTGIRIFEYREDDEEGCESNKELLALNGRKFKVASAMPFSSAGDYLAETTITLID